MRQWALACLLLLAPTTAKAEWLQASSAHFVVYANDTEGDLRRFSQQLERYHAAMAKITTAHDVVPSPSNRVTVYVVRNGREVRELYGEGSKYIGGFYLPRAGGSLAIVSQISVGGKQLDFSMIALLHEYAHHFMISNNAFPMARWYSEGGAEFFASASFEADGSVGLGRPAYHRAGELLYARDVTASDLLSPERYKQRKRNGYDAFYGKSWLLFHYLTFDDQRKGQVARYLQLMSQGKSSSEAGVEAFGDFAQLEKDLDSYMVKSRVKSLRLPPSYLETGPIEIRRLSAGEAAMMPVRIRSRRGVDDEAAAALLPEARAVAQRFPGDAAVLSALAEAEFDAGNDKEAIAAADAAIALDPGQVNAYVQKGYALFRMADDADNPETAYAKARAPFLALNKREPSHPLPLYYNYLTYLRRGKEPTPNAVEGLARAVEVAPFDENLRMTLVMQEIREGQRDAARRNLAPIAFDPHGKGLAEAARRVLAKLDSDPNWNGAQGWQALMADEATTE